MAYDILVVDDEKDIRAVIADLLEDEGYTARCAIDGPSALEETARCRPNLVLLDIWLGDTRFDGLKVLEALKRDYAHLPVVMMSGHGNIETAVNAIKHGAYDFIEKPFKSERLLLAVERAMEAAQLRTENAQLRSKAELDFELVGESSYVLQLRQTIEKVSQTNSRVLITGPSGSGKEIIAHQIHVRSARSKKGSFIVLNCGVIDEERFEEQLFGTEPRSDEGITPGILEQAHHGTLLLDEVSDMPLGIQGKMARILQEGRFCRMGGQRRVEIDVRIISASSRNLEELIKRGLFREDLFYRLNVVPITLKPLRERKEDIPYLAAYFLRRTCDESGQLVRSLSEDAIVALQAYSWPGDIRQLRSTMEWALIMGANDTGSIITAEMLPPEINANMPSLSQWEGGAEILNLPLRNAREIFERQYLLTQVSRFSGNISQTAAFVGMERSALHRKLRALGVQRDPEN